MKYLLVVVALGMVAGLAVLALGLLRQRSEWKAGGSPFASLDSVPQSAWDHLAEKRILFGHMSVGYDILGGVDQILKERPNIRLRVVEWDGKQPLSGPGLWHAKLGGNGDPVGKMKRFSEMLQATQSAPPDLAFMKLCYVDVGSDTDVTALQVQYRETLNGAEKTNAQVRVLHATVPLCSQPVRPKARVRRVVAGVLGRPGPVQDNVRREEFNAWLRAQCGKEGRLLDLARYESTGSAGTSESAGVPMLPVEYTDDGGHLNEMGRRWVAERFLVDLVNAAR